MPSPVLTTPQPIDGQPSGLKYKICNFKPKKLPIILTLIVIVIGLVIAGCLWYFDQLSAPGKDTSQLILEKIESGASPDQVAKQLEVDSIIKNATVFSLYIRLTGKQGNLQAGSYRLSPAESVPEIVSHLVNGSVDTFNITFYPGATIRDYSKTNSTKKYDATTVLKNAGYSDQDISSALTRLRSGSLFSGRPDGTDLEGYIYGDTYKFSTGATAEQIVDRVLDEMLSIVEDNNLVNKFKDHGLSLYQGIILASIVQREASNPDDQKKIAQVFYSRLDSGMVLGSDVTYQYIADRLGVARDPGLDSPYNTRRYPGLPPGPISSPGLSALLAVSNPASGDYLYFLSGDDDVTYFAHTLAEHEANIIKHCAIKCSSP
ncbi:endolytic transglycosylase MltG [Candidatus Saccharibacteria bacterium]|nr:endolytic transglycosylase MltG [Candidatus Saccharibacteria bacterium]